MNPSKHDFKIIGLIPSVSLLATSVLLVAAGCTCTAISNHEWVGHKPPKINGPEEVSAHLRKTVNGGINSFGRAAGFLTTPFKRLGISGWSDLGYDGEITGVVVQTANSTDRFYTVDMKLKTLQVDGKDLTLAGDRYLRAEVCLCDVELHESELPRIGETVWMRGRIVWDGDGFIEIHPRNQQEVKTLARQ